MHECKLILFHYILPETTTPILLACFLLYAYQLVSLLGLRNALFSPRRHINGMRQFGRFLILLVNFDGLIRFARHESRSCQVELRRHDRIFRRGQTAGLHLRLRLLKGVACLVVPKVHATVVAARNEHAIVIDCHGIDHSLVARKGFQKATILALPLLQTIGGARLKGIFKRRLHQCANGLLMIRQGRKALASDKVPQLDGTVVRSGNHLRMRRLCE